MSGEFAILARRDSHKRIADARLPAERRIGFPSFFLIHQQVRHTFISARYAGEPESGILFSRLFTLGRAMETGRRGLYVEGTSVAARIMAGAQRAGVWHWLESG